MAKWRRFWIVLPTSLIILTIGVLVWNSSLSGIDPDPPPIVHRDPPEGVETKSKRHPPETVIIENVTGEVKRGLVNITDAQSGN
jgi:hypothetical protein